TRIDFRIVIHRLPEKWNHPLVNLVLPVIALIVRDPRSRHGRFEAIGLGHSPHRHESAVAPSCKAEPIGIDGRHPKSLVNSREDVTEIPITEIPHVGPSERLALAKAAARVRLQNE